MQAFKATHYQHPWHTPTGLHIEQWVTHHLITPANQTLPSLKKIRKSPAIARQSVQALQALCPVKIQLLAQSHSHNCARITTYQTTVRADASITKQSHLALGVYTADCLPIVMYCQQSKQIAAIHAGWRGLKNRIIYNTLRHFSDTKHMVAYIGANICQQCYTVGQEFQQAFLAHDPKSALFFQEESGKHYFDCRGYAQHQLTQMGIRQIAHDHHCTHTSTQLPSYRVNPKIMTRLITMIWQD